VPVAELDVESEIYERLYGLPRRERHNGGPEERPIVIVDGATRAGTGAGEANEGPVLSRSAGRRRGRTVALGHELNRLGGEVLEAAAAGAQWVRDELPPRVEVASAAVRRRPHIAGGLAAALVAVPLLALLVSANASPTAVRMRLAPTPPQVQAALASAQPATPSTARRRSSPQPTDTAAEASAGPASGTGMGAAAIQHRPSKAHVLTHRTRARRPKRTAPSPPSPAPIKRPTAHERPAHRPLTPTTPPAATSPTTPGSGPNVTGGQPAPPG
jgi:hypothetical protein